MLLKAWDNGKLWAGELLSYGYTANWFGDNDYQMALNILYRLIRHKYPIAKNNLGFMYMCGQGVKKSCRWAKYWLEKAI
jgi:TPR repeat protein